MVSGHWMDNTSVYKPINDQHNRFKLEHSCNVQLSQQTRLQDTGKINIMGIRTRALLLLVTLFVSEIHSRDVLCNLKACRICSGYNLSVETCCQFDAIHSLCEECLASTDDPIELQVCLEEGHPSVSKRRGLLGKRSLEKRRGMIGK
ncbi:hypothetical protein PHET_08210 [Paragonimus heterotremus]|uniref:Uncharacterized protein n=1 Tax=Paragonimus heterotremus TaxID=100268 RepID=A0A8J4TEQ0_9TREM|nr:hypothetical protein PHET_08210 [Paragonimus heterotremus]